MGFLNSSSSVTLTAKLTPFGRKQLLANNNAIITQFLLGDSDANYQTDEVLTTGNMPAISGNLGQNNALSNSSAINTSIKNIVPFSPSTQFKPVELGSTSVTEEMVKNNTRTIAYSGLTQTVIDRTNLGTGSTLTNLFKTFNLPITSGDKTLFTTIANLGGGFSDTALSGFNQDQVLVINIPSGEYGEQIDGKSIKVDMETTGGTLEIYGTYQNLNQVKSTQDNKLSEDTVSSKKFGDNVVFLFSDEILRPNSDTGKTWSTGYGTTKPYSVNGKELFNLVSGTNKNRDVAVGMAFLDKGFIVITDQTIVSDYVSSGTTVQFNDYYSEIYQSVNILANRNEFNISNNPTFQSGDTIRISEIGLYDKGGNLIAIAKPDRHVTKRNNEIFASAIKIVI